jgi:hypothetical protein
MTLQPTEFPVSERRDTACQEAGPRGIRNGGRDDHVRLVDGHPGRRDAEGPDH